MDESDDMPIPVDPRDAEIVELKAQLAAVENDIAGLQAEIAALKQGTEERSSYIEMLEQQTRVAGKMLGAKDAKIAELSESKLPTGGIHPASTLAGGNVDHPPRTRDEGRIHVTDQY